MITLYAMVADNNDGWHGTIGRQVQKYREATPAEIAEAAGVEELQKQL